jgi:hypothetical protein
MALKFIDEIDNISLSKEEETSFSVFYDKIKDDIQTTRIERGYDELKGIREIKHTRYSGLPCALITMMMCMMFTGWITFVITITSITYIGICY